MTPTCVDLINPLDASTSDLLARLGCAARDSNADLFLVGAFAREVLFYHLHDIETERKTLDTDVSVRVANWNAFQNVRGALEKYGFEGKDNVVEKFIDSVSKREIDVIPFGAVAGSDARLTWPNDGPTWNVLGFEEALNHALFISVQAASGAVRPFRVANIASLVMLKMISFYDRPNDRKRDVRDIGFMIQHYCEAGNQAQLLASPQLVARAAQDPLIASAFLMGMDIQRIAHPDTRAFLLGQLRKETVSSSKCPFAKTLASHCLKGKFDDARAWLQALVDGLSDAL